MKTLLIIDPALGHAKGYLARQLAVGAASKAGITLTDNAEKAGQAIVIGNRVPANDDLKDKPLCLVDIAALMRQRENALTQAIDNIRPLNVPANAGAVDAKTRMNHKRLLAITACPTGVAHTFMAAEAIETEAKKRGWWVKVETRGSVGARNLITSEEVAAADLVIVAADIEVDMQKFAGKPIYRTTTRLALKKTEEELDNAVTQACAYQRKNSNTLPDSHGREQREDPLRHLLTGVSYMVPMVVAGGLCIALSFAFGITAFEKPGSLTAALMQIGHDSAFRLIAPVLAGFIAFSIADRPGLTPGLIGGLLATSVNAGFLGGIVAGFMAGYSAKFLNNQVKLPKSMEALKPVLIIPLAASLITGLMMLYIVGVPVAAITNNLTYWLANMGATNAVLMGAILGAMVCVDMGGPLNKVAYTFGIGLLGSHNYTPMAAIMAAGMVPPLAMGLATILVPKKFDSNQQEGGKASLVLGLCFITEGAIPFAARDPMRVLPCCIAGGALTGAISMYIGAELMSPHGGFFVLLIPKAITPVGGYLAAIAFGTLVAGLSYALFKRRDVKMISVG